MDRRQWMTALFAIAAKPKAESKAQLISVRRLPDDLLRTFAVPVIDECLTDRELFSAFNRQCERVIGKRKMADLMLAAIADKRPDLTRRPRIWQRIRNMIMG
jgi:hypothetical protein